MSSIITLGSFHGNGCDIGTKIAMFKTMKKDIFINEISIFTFHAEYTIDNLHSQYKVCQKIFLNIEKIIN